MASIESLEREVHRLRKLVNESVGSPTTQKREADVLIGDGEGSERRGFAAACAASGRAAIRKQLAGPGASHAGQQAESAFDGAGDATGTGPPEDHGRAPLSNDRKRCPQDSSRDGR
jgi:hypothetical protein